MLRRALCLAAAAAGAGAENIVIAGDSWADYLGIPNREFPAVFQARGDGRTIRNIAVGGTTCAGWAAGNRLQQLVSAVSAPDAQHLWLICGGNDAQFTLPGCSPQAECVDRIIAQVRADIRRISEAVHAANPRVKIVGFGYDIMGFGSIVGQLLVRTLLPECGGDAFCSNTEWLRMQEIYDTTARELEYFDSVNLLGSLQASQNVPGASIGNPVVGEWSPNSEFDLTSFHPTAAGYRTLFDNFYTQYWSRHAAANTTLPKNATLPAVPRRRASLRISDCTGAGGKFDNVRFTAPPTLSPGETADIKIDGDLREQMTSPEYTLTVSYLGLPVMNHKESACGSSRISLPLDMGDVSIDLFNCPAAPGPISFAAKFNVALIPPGSVITDIKALDDEGHEALCIKVDLTS